MERLKLLQSRREALEIEAECITQELTSHGLNGEKPAGIKDSLIDSEGFPRGDIDIYNVKNKRQRLAVINTDYKALMKEIETLLIEIYSDGLLQSTEEKSSKQKNHQHQQQHQQHNQEDILNQQSMSSMTVSSSTTVFNIYKNKKCIAVLDEILMGSPSEQSGLKNGDELISFGGIDIDTVDPISKIPPMVRENVDKTIDLVVKRKEELINISLIPKLWRGNGLLGCHLAPRNV
jgi:26S proteasome non-ATPase regulatory subunit 9